MNSSVLRPHRRQRILVTGASGCVGHYVVEDLLAQTDHEVVVLLRDRSRLRLKDAANPRLTIIEADIRDFEKYRGALVRIDSAVLVAAAWGGPEAAQVNLDAANTLTAYLATQGAGKVIYFSTASVLDRDGALLPAANEFGTDYIRSKYRLVQKMENYAGSLQVTGLFPTLVFGGDPTKPYSHFVKLLAQARRWIWLMRLFRVPEGRFHVVHALDIARSVRCAIEAQRSSATPGRLVLGNAAQGANDYLREFCAHHENSLLFGINLNTRFAEALIRTFRIELSPWDRYCMLHPDQSYGHSVTPAVFDLPVAFPDFPSMLESVDFAKLSVE